MRRALLFSAAGAATIVVLGCSQSSQATLTQLIVVVDTDYAIPSELDEIDIVVAGPDGMQHTARQPMVRAADLPYTLAVVPIGSTLGPVRVEATGLHGGASVVSRAARVTLIADQTVYVTLYLLHACARSRVTCTGASQTCGDAGTCQSIDVTVRPWTGTPPRIGTDAGAPPDAGGPNDAGPRDVGPQRDSGPPNDTNLPDTNAPDTSAPDAAVDCRTTGCDDGNPCTTDVCGANGVCTHTNNMIACDDGVFCNGLDTCGGGTCSVHAGSPCGAATCNEATRRCGNCATSADCPAPVTGAFGACGGFASACATAGTQSRTVRTFMCLANSCVPNDTMDTQGCTRTTDGTMCMATSCGAFGACAGFASACATSGTQSRTCTDYACAAGVCAGTPRTEMQVCSRTTDGTTCMATSCGAWGPACDYTANCMATGQVQSRTCMDYTCSATNCNASAPRTEMQPCPLAGAGTICTDPTIHCGVWHCNGAGNCAQVSGFCPSGRICCNPPVCQLPLTC